MRLTDFLRGSKGKNDPDVNKKIVNYFFTEGPSNPRFITVQSELPFTRNKPEIFAPGDMPDATLRVAAP